MTLVPAFDLEVTLGEGASVAVVDRRDRRTAVQARAPVSTSRQQANVLAF